jgi:hypothetical protein
VPDAERGLLAGFEKVPDAPAGVVARLVDGEALELPVVVARLNMNVPTNYLFGLIQQAVGVPATP